jgi:hypothetical protein
MAQTRQPRQWVDYAPCELVDLHVGDSIMVQIGGGTTPRLKVYEGFTEERGYAFMSMGRGGFSINSFASPVAHIDFLGGGITLNLAGLTEVTYSNYYGQYPDKEALLTAMGL